MKLYEEYDSLEKQLFKYTNEWTKDNGSFPVGDRTGIRNAEEILKKHYKDVFRAHLDYKRGDENGVDYVVMFGSPFEFTPDFGNPGLINGGQGDGSMSFGESLDEDTDTVENDYKQEFIDYCSDKIEDLGEVTITDEWGDEVTYPVALIGDIRDLTNVKFILDDENPDVLKAVNENGELVLNTPMYTLDAYTAEMRFSAISQSFYDDMITYWDDMSMDWLVDEVRDNDFDSEDIEEGLDYEDLILEKIVKKGSKYQVQSEKGRNMGTYDTKSEAEERLKQVEMFKHLNEDENKQGFIIWQTGGSLGDKYTLEDKVFSTKEEAKKALKDWEDSYGTSKSYYRPAGLITKYKGKTPKETRKDNNLDESIEKHDELNQSIFNEDKLDPQVREKLLDVANRFIEALKADNIELEPIDIVLLGSNASYNYTNDSDLDTHIIADMSVYKDQEDLAQKIYQAYKTIWNNKYDPMIKGHEVEIYIEPDKVSANSNGIYSIMNDAWLKVPDPDKIPAVDMEEVNKELEPWRERASKCETIEDINNLIDDIYILRQSSILKDGEYGIGNLVFKEFRNLGLLKELKDRKTKLESEEMSLNEKLNLMEDYSEENKLNLLAKYLNIDPSNIEYNGDYFEAPDGDYLVCTSEEAYERARDEIENFIADMGIEGFTKNFQDEILNDPDCIDVQKVDDIIDEEIDYFTTQEPDEELVDHYSNLSLTDKIEELKDLGFNISEFLNTDVVVDLAIDWDGVAHFIATYDGNEIDLDTDLFAYRIN